MVIHLRRLNVVLFLVFLLASGIALAQSRSTGEIRGTVTDQSGAAIPDVEVTVTNTQTGVQTRVTSDSSGIYDAIFLVPGTYSIAFAKSGFKAFVRSGVALGVQVINVDARLEVGAVSQQVMIDAAASGAGKIRGTA